MAQGKGKAERKSAVTQAEASLIAQLEKLSAIKTPTDAQNDQRKALRKQIAPLRFVRLAQQRVPRAVKALHAVAKLTGPGYMHTEEHATKIMKLIDAAVETVRSNLTGVEAEQAETFTL